MALQVIKPQPTFGELLFGGLGAGIGEGLSKVAEGQEQRVARESLAQQYQEFIGSDQYQNLPMDQKISLTNLLFPDAGKAQLQQQQLAQQRQLKETELGQQFQKDEEKRNLIKSVLGDQFAPGGQLGGGGGGAGGIPPQPLQPGMAPQALPGGAVGGVPETDQQMLNENPLPGQQQPENPRELAIGDFSDEKLVAMKGLGVKELNDIADAEMNRRGQERRRFEADRQFAQGRAGPYLKKIDENREAVRAKKFSQKLMMDAIENENLEFFSPDNLANVTGIEAFRTAKGAQFLTALKENLLSNISRAGARPNMWIEQQINKMAPQIGRSREANMTVAKMLMAENALIEQEIGIADNLSAEYKQKLGYVPENIASLVDSAMKPISQDIQDNLSYDMRKIHEKETGKKKLIAGMNKKVPRDTPLTPAMTLLFLDKLKDPKKVLAHAKKMGYKIPSTEQYRRYEE